MKTPSATAPTSLECIFSSVRIAHILGSPRLASKALSDLCAPKGGNGLGRFEVCGNARPAKFNKTWNVPSDTVYGLSRNGRVFVGQRSDTLDDYFHTVPGVEGQYTQ